MFGIDEHLKLLANSQTSILLHFIFTAWIDFYTFYMVVRDGREMNECPLSLVLASYEEENKLYFEIISHTITPTSPTTIVDTRLKKREIYTCEHTNAETTDRFRIMGCCQSDQSVHRDTEENRPEEIPILNQQVGRKVLALYLPLLTLNGWFDRKKSRRAAHCR